MAEQLLSLSTVKSYRIYKCTLAMLLHDATRLSGWNQACTYYKHKLFA